MHATSPQSLLGRSRLLLATASCVIGIIGAHDVASAVVGHKRYFQASW